MKHINQQEDQTVYIRPSIALQSLTAYNETLFMLRETCRLALAQDLVDPLISMQLQQALDEVEKFHKDKTD